MIAYCLQSSSLLAIAGGALPQTSVAGANVAARAAALLSISPDASVDSACVVPGLAASLGKLALSFLFPAAVAAVVACWMRVSRSLRPARTSAPAFVHLALFSYTRALSSTAALLQCVALPGVDGTWLYAAGTVRCWAAAWQWLVLLALSALVALPACVALGVHQGPPGAVTRVLAAAYSARAAGWEAVLAAQRLALVLLSTSVSGARRERLLRRGWLVGHAQYTLQHSQRR